MYGGLRSGGGRLGSGISNRRGWECDGRGVVEDECVSEGRLGGNGAGGEDDAFDDDDEDDDEMLVNAVVSLERSSREGEADPPYEPVPRKCQKCGSVRILSPFPAAVNVLDSSSPCHSWLPAKLDVCAIARA